MPSDSPIDNLSVIIPAYNAAEWLPQSVPKVAIAAQKAGLGKVEIIIVDDGSSDNTAGIAKALKVRYPVKVISQPNGGRFLARHTGVLAAKYDYILFIDTRVFIGEASLKYLVDTMRKAPGRLVWTSHAIIDRQGNIYARFWEALTFITWRQYFGNPRDCSYGIKDFDRYPKGMTCFFAPKQIMLEADGWFEGKTKNARASNDDTLIIRHIAEKHNINLNPQFYCTYHARAGLRQYSTHVYHRGKVFVDGFLRRDGNRFFWPLVGFLVSSVAVPVYLIIFPHYIVAALVLLGAAWALELLAAWLLKVPGKDALSLFILSPLFAVLYGAGIWSAVFDIYAAKLWPNGST